jgi:tetratricopeptide (TPR) repeat protein
VLRKRRDQRRYGGNGAANGVVMGEGPVTDDLARVRDAVTRGAWQEALDLFGTAPIDRLGVDDLPLLGQVAYAAGELDLAIATWERAYATSLESGDSVAAAMAASRVAMHLLFDTALLAPVRGWLARAKELLDEQHETPAHAWHAVVRAYERMLSGDLDGAQPWARRAIDAGCRVDPSACALGRVVDARLAVLAGRFHEGLQLLDEVGVAAVSNDLDPLTTGVVYCELVCALQGLGQYDAAEEWTHAMERWCRPNAIGSLHGRCRVHRAEILRLRGQLDQAEAEVLAACDELRPYVRREMGWPLSELGTIRLHRGDLDGAEDALVAAHQLGWDPQPTLARVRLQQGDVETASASVREALDRPPWAPSKERPPDTDLQRAPVLELEIEIAVEAGDIDRARAAAGELATIAERFPSRVMAASRSLAEGRISLAADQPSDAVRSLAEAVHLYSEMGAPYQVAVARACLARAHEAAGEPRSANLELEAARVLLDRLTAGGTGRPAVNQGHTTPPADTDTDEATDVFRREGDYWSVTFAGRTMHVRDLKGMRYLARLLAEPGRELHALDLVETESGAALRHGRPVTVVGSVLGDAGELLDEQAKQAYRRRLTEIEEDLEEARGYGDERRVEQAQAEYDFLVRELSRAFGLHGSQRRAGSAPERARVAVTRAIRTALARITEHHEPLGEHLNNTIRTGTFCSYQPDPRVPTRWTT